MKRYFTLLLSAGLLLTGCQKDSEAPAVTETVASLPFEDEQLKLERVSSALPQSIWSMHFMSAMVGVAATYGGKIYRTTDGGITWTLQFSTPAPNQPLLQLLFTSPSVGYAAGGSTSCGGTGCVPPGGLIVKTTDGGITWTTVYQAPGVEISAIAANGSGDVVAIARGTGTQLLKSADAGATWMPTVTFANPLNVLAFDQAVGYAAGANGKTVSSTNGGATWSASTTVNSLYTADLKALNGVGYYLSNNQEVLKTTDKGVTWKSWLKRDFSTFVLAPLTSNKFLAFGSGHYSGGDFGYAYGAVRQTTNGGATWKDIELRDSQAIRVADFYTTAAGYAVAGNTLIRVTVK